MAVLAATEPTVEVMTLKDCLSVLTDHVVCFVVVGSFAWRGQLDRNDVRSPLVRDLVTLDQVLDEGTGIFLGARYALRSTRQGGGRYRKARALRRHMTVQSDTEAGRERPERKVRGVLRSLLVSIALAIELKLLTARRTTGDAEGIAVLL